MVKRRERANGRQRASKQATLPPVCPRAGKEACVLPLSGARKEPARASRGSFASCQPCAGRRMKRLAARQHATHLAPDSGRQRSRRAGTLQGHERTLAHAARRARQSAHPDPGAARHKTRVRVGGGTDRWTEARPTRESAGGCASTAAPHAGRAAGRGARSSHRRGACSNGARCFPDLLRRLCNPNVFAMPISGWLKLL